MPLDSKALVEELAAGHEAAYAALYDQLGPGLYKVAWRILGRREDAEDAVQEVFVALVRSRNTLSGVGNLKGYLLTALRRAAVRILERRPAMQVASEFLDAATPASPTPATISERLERALAALPLEQREVLALKVEGALTFEEIAALLSISANTAASRYRYALEKLRTLLRGTEHV